MIKSAKTGFYVGKMLITLMMNLGMFGVVATPPGAGGGGYYRYFSSELPDYWKKYFEEVKEEPVKIPVLKEIKKRIEEVIVDDGLYKDLLASSEKIDALLSKQQQVLQGLARLPRLKKLEEEKALLLDKIEFDLIRLEQDMLITVIAGTFGAAFKPLSKDEMLIVALWTL